MMAHVMKYYREWKPSNYTLVTPQEPIQRKQKRAHYDWPTKTLPMLVIGFHGPAYSDEQIDMAALDLLSAVAFSRSSQIYQKLVIEEQKCQSLSASFSDRRDPYLLTFNAVVKEKEDIPYVENEIFKELERLKQETVSEEKLADVKSNQKYSFARAMATTDGVASALAHYINLATDPETVNMLYVLYEKVTTKDIQDMAKKYFQKASSTVVTLYGR
jgi:zinc protease